MDIPSKTTPKAIRRPSRRQEFSHHALLRFVERSSRVPMDMHYLSFLKKRHAEGIVGEPSDIELIEYVEKGNSLERYRRQLRELLAFSRVVYWDTDATYRAIGRGLIAVMEPRDRIALTILPAEFATRNIPRAILEAEGVLEEEPYPTLTPELIAGNSGFLYGIVRRRSSNTKPSRFLKTIEDIDPPVEILFGRGTLELVVKVHSRETLRALDKYSALTVTPHVAEFAKTRKLLAEERAKFPELDWEALYRKLGMAPETHGAEGKFRRGDCVGFFTRWLAVFFKKIGAWLR